MNWMIQLGAMLVLLGAAIVFASVYMREEREWAYRATVGCVIALTLIALSGCSSGPGTQGSAMSEFLWLLGKGVVILLLVAAAYSLYAWCSMYAQHRKWGGRVVLALLALAFVVALAACESNPVIQPVRYQTVEVLVVKPCLAGRQLPERAQVLTAPACNKSAAECVRDARADIDDLKREADASRRLLEGCSK